MIISNVEGGDGRGVGEQRVRVGSVVVVDLVLARSVDADVLEPTGHGGFVAGSVTRAVLPFLELVKAYFHVVDRALVLPHDPVSHHRHPRRHWHLH